jgi:quercetin dioxygenase-like cupin family protein
MAQAETRLVTVPVGDDGFAPFVAGVRIKMLHGNGERLSYLLQLAPGAAIPPHRHPVDEACVVLQGTLHIGDAHVVGAGGFHLAPAGSLHAAVASHEGALIFLHGAVPAFEDLL